MEFKVMPLKSDVSEIVETSGYEMLVLKNETLFPSREEAEAIIEEQGGSCAVRFKHVALDQLEPTVTMGQITDRIRRMREQRDKFEAEHSIHELSAKLVTCTNCESKIAKSYVEGEMCPVCGNDLRSPYIPAQIATYEEKIAELQREYNDARERQLKRALAKGEIDVRVMWLVPVHEQAR